MAFLAACLMELGRHLRQKNLAERREIFHVSGHFGRFLTMLCSFQTCATVGQASGSGVTLKLLGFGREDFFLPANKPAGSVLHTFH